MMKVNSQIFALKIEGFIDTFYLISIANCTAVCIICIHASLAVIHSSQRRKLVYERITSASVVSCTHEPVQPTHNRPYFTSMLLQSADLCLCIVLPSDAKYETFTINESHLAVHTVHSYNGHVVQSCSMCTYTRCDVSREC